MQEEKLLTVACDAEGLDDEETIGDDDAISEPYDPNLINIDLKPYPILQVMRKIKQGAIDLEPEFQRNFVWDETRQSRLIESVLIRIPLPAFYLDVVNERKWLVVDGLQRLSTLDRFCNKQELRLQNLQFLRDLEGKTFDDLPLGLQTRMEDTHLNFYLVLPNTPSNVKFTIFSRINTGGLVLTAQEIRHSVYQGKATKFLKGLSVSQEFQIATSGSIPTKRMEDREYILRFLAFYLTPYADYKSPLDRFLNDAMETINNMNATMLDDLRDVFKSTMLKASEIFGQYAFRKMYSVDGRKYPINKSLFEVWSVMLSRYDIDKLVQHKDDIIRSFIDIMKNNKEFAGSITQSTGGINTVRMRFSTIEKLLGSIIQ